MVAIDLCLVVVILQNEFLFFSKEVDFSCIVKERIMAWEMQLDEKVMEDLYKWLDSLPLTRPKRNIERDFSDGKFHFSLLKKNSFRFFYKGKLVAEIIHHYLPNLVDLHNYSSANSLDHKRSNWFTLNKKVLSQFGLDLSDVIITGLSNGKPGLIEVLLYNVRLKIDEELELQSKDVHQSSLSLTSNRASTKLSSNRLNESMNLNQNISRLDYEEIKQQYLEQEVQLEALQAKFRRLEHLVQLKDDRINDLTRILQNDQNIKSHRSKK